MGTTNDIGTMYGYGRNIYANLQMLMEGEIKKVDICTINGIPSVYVAGYGKYLNIPYMTSREDKKKLGYLAYMINGVKEFFKFIKLRNITYEVDGEIYKGYYSFIICTNSTRVAGLNNILSDTIKLDDNKFEIVLCNISSRKKLINSLIYLVTSDIKHVPGFYYHKTDEIKIHMLDGKGSDWDIDGEKLEIESPDITIKMDRDTELMIPKKNINKLFVNKE